MTFTLIINTSSWSYPKNLGFNSQNKHFHQSDLDLHPMVLVLKLDLDMVKILHHTKNEVSMSKHSTVIVQTDRHTDRQTDTHTDSMKTIPSRIRGR